MSSMVPCLKTMYTKDVSFSRSHMQSYGHQIRWLILTKLRQCECKRVSTLAQMNVFASEEDVECMHTYKRAYIQMFNRLGASTTKCIAIFVFFKQEQLNECIHTNVQQTGGIHNQVHHNICCQDREDAGKQTCSDRSKSFSCAASAASLKALASCSRALCYSCASYHWRNSSLCLI